MAAACGNASTPTSSTMARKPATLDANVALRLKRNRLLEQIRDQKFFIRRQEQVIAELPAQIADLETRLVALDITFGLHDLEIDPARIEGKKRRVQLQPQGALLRRTLRFLRMSGGSKFTSSELAAYLDRNGAFDADEVDAGYTIWKRTKGVLRWIEQQGFVAEERTAEGKRSGVWQSKTQEPAFTLNES